MLPPALALMLAVTQSAPAPAQEAGVRAVVSGFSGRIADAAQNIQVLDINGVSLSIHDMAELQAAAASQGAAQGASIRAADIGQVFALAASRRPDGPVFAAATSFYGLYRNRNNSGWMNGMWGRGGGPGTIYRIEPGAAPKVSVLADVGFNGRANSGAGLSALAYDEARGLLFAADLESGIIHRLDAKSGEERELFDHGVDGRSYFRDAAAGQHRVLDVVSFDGKSRPAFATCADGAAQDAGARFAANPNCWNIADFRRRVSALALHADPGSGATRLYYAIWGAAAFGNPQWSAGSEAAQNSVWSIGLDASGGFDFKAIRREFVMPADAPGASGPVTAIAFDGEGAMVLAQRGAFGMPAGEGPIGEGAMLPPGRVLRYTADDEGRWTRARHYDLAGAGGDAASVSAAGGAALGPGPTGAAAAVWATFKRRCASNALCPRPRAGLLALAGDGEDAGARGRAVPLDRDGGRAVLPGAVAFHGPVSAPMARPMADQTPPPERGATPPQPPALPAASPDDAPDDTDAAEDGAQADAPPAEEHDEQPAARGPGSAVSLAADIAGPERCAVGDPCHFEVAVTTADGSAFAGPMAVTIEAADGAGLDMVEANGWRCVARAGSRHCYGRKAAGGALPSLTVALSAPAAAGPDEVQASVCVALAWLGERGIAQDLGVQVELGARGYGTGTPDGIVGANTRRAIAAAQRQSGLAQTGAPSRELAALLFGADAPLAPGGTGEDHRACVQVAVELPPRPEPQPQPQPQPQTQPRVQSPAGPAMRDAPPPIEELEEDWVEETPLWRFHQTYRSSMHDGGTSGVAPAHRPPAHQGAVSRFHGEHASQFHEGRSSRHVSRFSRFHATRPSRDLPGGFAPDSRVHDPSMSRVHDTYPSAMHDMRSSRVREDRLHHPTTSRLHRSVDSSQHDGRTTGVIAPGWRRVPRPPGTVPY